MQRILLVLLLILNTRGVNAQSSDEWLKQKQTQIKYLVEQIGALKAYGEVINKGYDIARNGLTNVFSSKEGDYRQHSNYFLSLWKVKPVVKSYGKLLSILNMKADIEKQYRLKSSATGLLNEEERRYVNTVFASLISGCRDLSKELEMVINDDQLQLKDDERIQRIDQIYLAMQDRYQFCQSFANEIRLLVLNRLKESSEISRLSSLYGIK
jgi:hypothetical protein